MKPKDHLSDHLSGMFWYNKDFSVCLEQIMFWLKVGARV